MGLFSGPVGLYYYCLVLTYVMLEVCNNNNRTEFYWVAARDAALNTLIITIYMFLEFARYSRPRGLSSANSIKTGERETINKLQVFTRGIASHLYILHNSSLD